MTYDEQDGSSANQVALEALVNDPACSVNIQSGQNLWKNDVNERCHENTAGMHLHHPR